MARPAAYYQPRASYIGIKNSMGPGHMTPSQLAASAQQNSVRDWTHSTFRSPGLPRPQSPEETRTSSDHALAVPANKSRRAQCKRKRGRGSTDRGDEKLRTQKERPRIQHGQDKIEIRQLREQLRQQKQSHRQQEQSHRQQEQSHRQQEQSHRQEKEDMRKFWHDRHAEASSVVRSVDILRNARLTSSACGV
ncbi:uncharacterized protein N7511_004284 [Penicillium nucicola]|uniref:uncharacterized protein n=1 Tax=Penicillium nucicola TaxID=1850975 RepID=UPI002545A419|nr:uncharacterized protein N7511_004284 [Penicillium nucicola]KAJ5766668.1 hypothetical protein N7511_004284 [Penicillium nucicola]